MTQGSRRSLQVAAASGLLGSFATAKTVAIAAGPSGVGYQGAIVSGGSLTALLATWGTANVLPQLAARTTDSEGRDFASAIGRATALALVPSAMLSWVLVLPELLQAFTPVVASGGLLLGTTAAVVMAVVPSMLTVFNGPGRAANYQLTASVGGAAVTIVAVLLVHGSLLPLAIGGGLLFGQAMALAISIRQVRNWRRGGRIPVRRYVSECAAVYISTVLSSGAIAFVPLFALRWSGADVAGLLRAASSLAGIPVAVLLTSVSLHYYSTIANLHAARASTSATTADSVRAVGQRAAWASLALGVTAPLALSLAYSTDFSPASSALALLLSGGLLRLMALHNAYLLLVNRRRKAYLAAEAIASSVLVPAAILASQTGSVTLLAGAVWLTSVIYYGTTTILLRRADDRGAVPRRQPGVVVAGHVVLPLLAVAWSLPGATSWISSGGG